MKTISKFSILTTAFLLAACSSSKQLAPVSTELEGAELGSDRLLQRDFVAETRNGSKPKTGYAQRRVVQISAPKKSARGRGMVIDIQEGKVRGVHNITSRYGENHTVEISRNYPNTILTPFADPQVYDNGNKTKFGLDNYGSNLIVTPRNNQKIWLTVYDLTNPRGLPVTLTLIPKPGLMSQTINVTVEKSPSEMTNGLHPSSGSFAQRLTNILKSIAMQKLPPGFIVRPLREKISLSENMQTVPVERYVSTEFDVYRYRVTNTGSIKFEFDEGSEEAFRRISKRVRAVTPYPNTTLYPGESTDVLILISKRGGRS